MNAPVTYTPKFVPEADKAFERLQQDLEWERRGDAPRCEYYCNDFSVPYVYGRGKGVREYLPKPYHDVILGIRKAIEEITGTKFEVCFLNMYLNQSDQLGWHADDSPEMDDARPIAIVSLGVEREIWFRTFKGLVCNQCVQFLPEGAASCPVAGCRGPELVKPTTRVYSPDEKLKLGHGSLALMAPGMQDVWQHRIPKSSHVCGARISLTFRGYIQS